MNEARSLSKTKRSIFALILLLGFPLAALVVVEGSISLLMFGRDYRNQQAPPVVRPHTTYDTLLGWVNRPGFSAPDEYGKGVALTTSALGFRGGKTIAVSDTATPRLVCLGDGFAQGYGVADDKAWCPLLESQFPGLQAVNMGQSAYGIDQSLLWYHRDAARVPHRVTLLALTYIAMERSVTTNFQGRFKPLLTLDGAQLVTRNVPVPAQTDEALRRAYAGRLISNLRVVQAFRRIPAFDVASGTAERLNEAWPTFEKMFSELQALNRANGSEFVLAYLPTKADMNAGPLDGLRARLAQYAEQQKLRYIDLTPAFRAMRKDSVDLLFITKAPRGAAPGVVGYYTNMANTWVAREFASRLRDLPAMTALPSPAASAPAPHK